jgi:hypothetical protein
MDVPADGTLAFRANDIVVNDEVVDSIYILSPSWGHSDDVSEEKVKARISRDGRSIIVTKPRTACQFFGAKSVEETDALWEGREIKTYDNIRIAHMILANRIHAMLPEERLKTVVYKMPGKIKIKADPFNDLNESNTIETEIVYTPCELGGDDDVEVDVDGPSMSSYIPHLQWHVAIDGPVRLLRQKAKVNKAKNAFKRAYTNTPAKSKMDESGGDDEY